MRFIAVDDLNAAFQQMRVYELELPPKPQQAAAKATDGATALANARLGLHWNGEPCCATAVLLDRRLKVIEWAAHENLAGLPADTREAFILWGFISDYTQMGTNNGIPVNHGGFAGPLDEWVAAQINATGGPSGG